MRTWLHDMLTRRGAFRVLTAGLALAIVVALASGCSSGGETGQKAGGGESKAEERTPEKRLSGQIIVDGSSTVFPITEAVAEEFQKEHPDVRVNVGLSGTGGGFKKFVVGEIDINDASRPIKDEEKQLAEQNGIDYVEFKIGFDGITVVKNPGNTWCDTLTMEELKKIWEPNSKVKNWSDIRKGWPARPIKLFGPDTDSGTFDYFTEEVVGEAKKSRSDYTASSDDNILVQGVAGEQYALGYFGYAYYLENRSRIAAVKIDGIEPTLETIKAGEYELSRPLFIYVRTEALKRPEVRAFVTFYLTNAAAIVKQVGYVPLSDDEYSQQLAELDRM